MAQNNADHILFACLILLSCSQGEKAEEILPTPEKDLPPTRINCPEGANALGSYCYYLVEDHMTWGEADLFCQNMNSGHLFSQAEGNFVASLVKESGTTATYVWIGLHDPKQNRRWHWSNGSPFLYKSWATGAPSTNNRGFCVSLTSNTVFKKWKDENCDALYFFVCKFKS
ncbi:Reg2 [Lemmus lemmus]